MFLGSCVGCRKLIPRPQEVCKPNIAHLRSKLQKPLRPIWVTQDSTLPSSPPTFPDFHPLILCTASRRVRGAEASEGGYIQGAADDHEAWSHGLTPQLFWPNKDVLMSTNEEEMPRLIANLMEQDGGKKSDCTPTLIHPTTTLFLSQTHNLDPSPFDLIIACTPSPLPPLPDMPNAKKTRNIHLPCHPGKRGSRDLRTHLPRLLHQLAPLSLSPSTKILVCCPTGTDLSVGVALALLCLYADEEGNVDLSNPRGGGGGGQKGDDYCWGKELVKRRLSWITMSNPGLNPSRATLQSVNAVLLSGEM